MVITPFNNTLTLIVMDYIRGKNYLSLGQKPSLKELESVVDMAVELSCVNYKPSYEVFDEWSILNFAGEYTRKRHLLNNTNREYVDKAYKRFERVNSIINTLPKTFVHGDITSTNLIRDVNNVNWLIDFSVSNIMPRIIEIVVICGDLAVIIGEEHESLPMNFLLWGRNFSVNETSLFPSG